ncbi:MAG: 50S ribosomal protein L18 [Minisyncoccia bacterium]
MKKMNKKKARIIRHSRLRAKIRGTSERPRLSVYRSLKHIYAQIIDDELGKTLVAASDFEIKKDKKIKKEELAKKVGELIAKKAKEKGIKKVVFDRGGFKYHGRIKALAEKARESGLVF